MAVAHDARDGLAPDRLAELLERKRALQESVLNRLRRNRLDAYRPYPKQYEFHALGNVYRERALMAGNQEGKSWAGSHELAMHATGLYPDWWPGRRFNRPILAWTGSPSSESSREIIQAALIGTEELDPGHPDYGTGAIPAEMLIKTTKRQAGIRDVADQIYVKHVNGGQSRIVLKTSEQGRRVWQGKKCDVVWMDEEMPQDIYSEAMTRTMAVEDGLIMTTFTPLLGMTEVVKRFLEPRKDDPPRGLVKMTIHDTIGGIWPAESPWAGQKWFGHYTREKVQQIIDAWPEHERRCRALGIPLMGQGLIFAIDEKRIEVQPFHIPAHWARIVGIDFGHGHPFAAAFLAHDRDNDVIYLYDLFRSAGTLPLFHVATIRNRPGGTWIPVAWPHDGLNREKSSGQPLAEIYRGHGLETMLPDSARYDDERGGRQDVEPWVLDATERMETGRFKVFSTCVEFFDEMRTYHRDNGQIVRVADDAISATRTGMVMIRYAQTIPSEVRHVHRLNAPVIGRRLHRVA